MDKKFLKALDTLCVRPGTRARLKDRNPADTLGLEDKKKGLEWGEEQAALWPRLQRRLYAENRQALLIVLQAMDAGGKDGVIRRVMSVLNPQGCRVTSFKAPSSIERSHDFLWRIHRAVPAAGEIGIFNRSQYEDVLIVRVHRMVPKTVWSGRYRRINEFEHLLAESGIRLLKLFLHISKDEQKVRLQERLDDPEKHWKMDPADGREREHWDDYQAAYEEALTRCSTPWAPWHVIPADRKWVRDLAVATLVRRTLEDMNPRFPPSEHDISKIQIV